MKNKFLVFSIFILIVFISGCRQPNPVSNNGVEGSFNKNYVNESIGTTQIDPQLIEKLKTQDEVRVAVILKDDLNLSCHGTIEQCRSIYERKKQYYLRLEDEVLSTLSEEDFRLIDKSTLNPAFTGYITRRGLEKLVSNPNVIDIQASKEVWLT